MNAISINDYTYELPESKIALEPLANRDASKLLVYRDGAITHTHFYTLADHLPANATLVFNDTRVIPARVLFQKDTGAGIEIFLLSPVQPSTLLLQTMEATGQCTWQCTIGNLKKWKHGTLQKQAGDIVLTATLTDREAGIVTFSWQPAHYTFAEVITHAGITPLPPYIKREASAEDVARYQTIYSHYDGAVAAPTAGLHFTERVFDALQQKGIQKTFLTLHVSAGTFQPVKTENALEHTMHREQVVLPRQTIEDLLQPNRFIVPVGTTAMRTLESLYWYGAHLMQNPDYDFDIAQHDPYTMREVPPVTDALQAVLRMMNRHNLQTLTGYTSIYIHPGYVFKLCQALITNFHLSGSTLMLLVAACIGDDWRTVYDTALQHDYRFLSYGDSSLLFLKQT